MESQYLNAFMGDSMPEFDPGSKTSMKAIQWFRKIDNMA